MMNRLRVVDVQSGINTISKQKENVYGILIYYSKERGFGFFSCIINGVECFVKVFEEEFKKMNEDPRIDRKMYFQIQQGDRGYTLAVNIRSIKNVVFLGT